MLSAWFGRRFDQPQLDPLRNAAVRAYVMTVPRRDRLDEFVATLDRRVQRKVRAAAIDFIAAAEEFLERTARTQSINLERFHEAMRGRLQRRFPWMDAGSFDAAKSFTSWYAWHEGYTA